MRNNRESGLHCIAAYCYRLACGGYWYWQNFMRDPREVSRSYTSP